MGVGGAVYCEIQWLTSFNDHCVRVDLLIKLVFDFFNNLNHFYGVITEFCTVENCPCMSAASR